MINAKLKQALLLVAVFSAGAFAGAFSMYTYVLWHVFDIKNEIK